MVDNSLRWELTGQESPKPIHLSAEVLKGLEGKYKAPAPPPGVVIRTGPRGLPPIEVVAEREGLQVDLGMMGKREFVPLSSTEFFDEDDPGTRLRFTNQNGRSKDLSIAGASIHLTASKLP
jgi:hypothetical protein